MPKLPKLAEKIEDYSIFDYTLAIQIEKRYQKMISDNIRER